MADQTVRFLPVTGNDNQTVLEVVLFEHDIKLGAMSYQILTTDIKGTPLLNLSNGASIVMMMNEAGELQLNYVFFKGRSIIYKDKGEILLLRLAQDLEEVGKVEQMPKLEGKRMIMFIAPTKKSK